MNYDEFKELAESIKPFAHNQFMMKLNTEKLVEALLWAADNLSPKLSE